MQSKIHTSITGKARESLVRILDYVLKEECFLLETTRNYHGNVRGPNLYSLHRLFDEQRRQIDYWLERVIEQAKSIGAGTRAASKRAKEAATPPSTGAGLPAHSMIRDLLGRHERMAKRLRDELERLRDPATADLLERIVEFHETTAWMLRVVHNGPETAAG